MPLNKLISVDFQIKILRSLPQPDRFVTAAAKLV